MTSLPDISSGHCDQAFSCGRVFGGISVIFVRIEVYVHPVFFWKSVQQSTPKLF